MWTQFWDMHSGGGQKEDFSQCFIEASEEEAKTIFYNRFGHSSERVTCTCCGEDYWVSEFDTLQKATAYHRGCDFVDGKYVEKGKKNNLNNYIQLSEYVKQKDVLVIYSKDIKASEKIGEVPDQGYVWVD